MALQSAHHNQPSRGFAAIVPSDVTLLPNTGKGVVCLTAGNLVAQNASGVSVTFPLTAGQFIRIAPTRVMAATTGTYALL